MAGKILNGDERTKGENMRKNLCIVLIILICFATIYTNTYADNETENNTVNNAVDLQTQRSDLQNQLNEANGQLNDVQSNLSENLQQVEKLDGRIETAEQELAEQESKITELKKSIEQIETQLNSVTEKYDKQVELFKKRMVAIYIFGDDSRQLALFNLFLEKGYNAAYSTDCFSNDNNFRSRYIDIQRLGLFINLNIFMIGKNIVVFLHKLKLSFQFLRCPQIIGIQKRNPFPSCFTHRSISGQCGSAVFLIFKITDTFIRIGRHNLIRIICRAVIYDE